MVNEDNENAISFLIEIPEELERFREYVEEGKEISDYDVDELRRKGIRNIEDFYFADDRIRFWTFSKNLGIREGNKILFLVNNETLYIFETSRVIKDEDIAKILGCYNEKEIPFVVLLKPIYRQIKYKYRINSSVINKIFKECEQIDKNIFKCKINLNDIIKSFISLEDYLRSSGYKFPSYLIAQFYTALKTKGFVILSGLSGTGKTKIALNFVKLLKRELPLEGIEVEKLNEFMTSSGPIFEPEKEIRHLKETIHNIKFAVKSIDYKGDKPLAEFKPPLILWIYNAIKNSSTYQKVVMGLLITDVKTCSYDELPGDWKNGLKWLNKVYGGYVDLERVLKESKLYVKIKYVWEVKKDINKFKDAETNENLSTKDASRMGGGRFIKVKSPEGLIPIERNYTFLPVRPDWRDSKPLLGYYNPLDRKYYKSALLDLILRAEKDYKENKEKALPYFIILDEMNLARVEYYFADFLSVLESGRENDGFTRETIKLHNVDEVEREQGIPKEIRLPPNLYIIGTVNIDETTYMFSPKVLDRAFVIEFHDVDMDGYPPSNEIQDIDYSNLRNRILEDLRGKDGKFLVYSGKEKIDEAINELKAKGYWTILQELNKALEPFDLHFGYRVIDEIALFFKNAKGSMDKGIVHFESDDEIFDLALLMKILPKFHGNKRKLEEPLKNILKVCLIENSSINIAELSHDKIVGILRDWENKSREFRFKHTAKKALRMLRQLYDVGFASFS